MEMALLSLPFLHSTWLSGQQHPTQLEHCSGAEQVSHELSLHPHELHEVAEASEVSNCQETGSRGLSIWFRVRAASSESDWT